ncbi:MAG: bifunctional riboflavin kinase/FAD synthetase [Cytophagales bacterium]|nr:bifunctional riboflavin kinase/FAD synthetase [Cytophagales bacterium]
MKVHHGIEAFDKPEYAVVTSGSFDGVHLGHQKILQHLRNTADKYGGETVLLTYWPHPRLVLPHESSEPLRMLMSMEEKIEALKGLGLDHLVILPFSRTFSQKAPYDFIKEILVEGIGTKRMVVGYDHRFGKNREGNFNFLKKNALHFGFEVEEIARQDIDQKAVSSTQTRLLLLEGKVDLAAKLTGRNYRLIGKVEEGKQIGRKLGFPTANLRPVFEHKLIPLTGVYAVRAKWNNQHLSGMLNIGFNPTVKGKHQTIEVYLFDFSQDIYQEEITIEFVQRIRNEVNFENLETLQQQLVADESACRRILEEKK